MALQTSNNVSGPAPKHTLEKILLIIAVVIALAAAQYFFMMFRTSEEPLTGYINNDTGQVLSQEEVRQVLERQAKESVTYVFAGMVSAKMKDVFYVNDGNGMSAKFKLAPNAAITRAGESATTSPAGMSYDDIKQGEYVSIIFPKGVLTTALASEVPVQVAKIIISKPGALME